MLQYLSWRKILNSGYNIYNQCRFHIIIIILNYLIDQHSPVNDHGLEDLGLLWINKSVQIPTHYRQIQQTHSVSSGEHNCEILNISKNRCTRTLQEKQATERTAVEQHHLFLSCLRCTTNGNLQRSTVFSCSHPA